MADQFKHLYLHPESIAYLDYIKENVNKNVKTIEDVRVECNKRFVYTTHTDRVFNLDKSELSVPSPHVKGRVLQLKFVLPTRQGSSIERRIRT